MSQRLSKNELYAAFDAQVKQGINPTSSGTHKFLGERGSLATVNKYLKQWRTENPDLIATLGPTKREIPEALNSTLEEAANLIWDAIELKEFNDRLAGYKEENEQLRTENEMLKRKIEKVESVLKAMIGLMKSKGDDVSHMEELLGELQAIS